MPKAKKSSSDRWDYFAGIVQLLGTVPQATTGQKAALAAMAFLSVMFIGLGLVGSVAMPAWAVVTMFSLAVVSIISVAGFLLVLERRVSARIWCRHVPAYPLPADISGAIRNGLEEIRRDAVSQISKKANEVNDENIRANIFLLAKITGGSSDGKWKLVIPDVFALNMNLPVERQLQFSIGQGATGVAYRDGTNQLTRRQKTSTGNWDVKYKITPELESQIEPRLRWIVTFPLIKPGTTSDAIGVLNIDGLVDVSEDDVLNSFATSVRGKVSVIATTLAFQPGTCVGMDELGVM